MARINYQSLLNNALLSIVRNVLLQIQKDGLDLEHSFYISFRTDFAGVTLSERVKSKYPQEITIILQHQFKNLLVFDDYFTVNISFDGISEDIKVPFASLTNFIDPIENFNLEFYINFSSAFMFPGSEEEELINRLHCELALENEEPSYVEEFIISKMQRPNFKAPSKNTTPAEVMSLEQFRKKRDSKQ
jgi:hypothetical protein